ncbi:MAG: hypothetical protein AABX99_03390 [Nanoarchaeota archaeon]
MEGLANIVDTFGRIAESIWAHERVGDAIICEQYFFRDGMFDKCETDKFLPGEMGYESLNKYLSEVGL